MAEPIKKKDKKDKKKKPKSKGKNILKSGKNKLWSLAIILLTSQRKKEKA